MEGGYILLGDYPLVPSCNETLGHTFQQIKCILIKLDVISIKNAMQHATCSWTKSKLHV